MFQPLDVRLGITVDLAVKLHIAPYHHGLVGREPCLQDWSVGWPFWKTEREILIYLSFLQQGFPSEPFISWLFSRKGADWDCRPRCLGHCSTQCFSSHTGKNDLGMAEASQPCHSFSGPSVDQLSNLLITDLRLNCWPKGSLLLVLEDAWSSTLGKKPSSCFPYPITRLFNITTEQLLRENCEISPNTSSWYVCLMLPYLFSTTQV